jgi:hypothetical protein
MSVNLRSKSNASKAIYLLRIVAQIRRQSTSLQDLGIKRDIHIPVEEPTLFSSLSKYSTARHKV